MVVQAGRLQRACACGGTCADCREKSGEGVPAPVGRVLSAPGRRLDPATRGFMETRFGHDFSRVRVHDDQSSADSARAVHGLAYTVGPHVVFGSERPRTTSRVGLLAHELAHVVQQDRTDVTTPSVTVDANAAAEAEAERAASDVLAGSSASVHARMSPSIARFSDTGHHVVEEAALPGAGFSEGQIRGIERGNVERDYSQVGVVGNAVLLCRPHAFGGYRPEEHFDNFIWDAVTRGWRTRGGSAWREQGVDAGRTPIDYISSELDEVTGRGLSDDAGLAHLGNAFHTVEDFFAHSNFVELMQGDTSRGSALMTGNPVGPSQSVSRILEAITPPGVQERYRAQSEEAIRGALPGSHTAMAHDDPTTKNYTIARRLAALVIQDLGVEVLAVMSAPQPTRSRLMRERVVAKAVRYLRPPDRSDRWWDALAAADAGRIDRRLDEAARRTPVTVNQCALSPLKNLEASRSSPMALPFGVAVPTVISGNQVWFQIGIGVNRPFPFEPLPGSSRVDDRGAFPIAGAQISGSF